MAIEPDNDEQIQEWINSPNFQKAMDDTKLESSPCDKCGHLIGWGMKFCQRCGEYNTDYDEVFDITTTQECLRHHEEIKDQPPVHPAYCSICGLKICD